MNLDLLQWPAMVVTAVAAFLVASLSETKRKIGFWCYLLSNALWSAWGFHTKAWAVVALQVVLLALNIRGVKKNKDAEEK
jgi:uncharacterized membrane protein